MRWPERQGQLPGLARLVVAYALAGTMDIDRTRAAPTVEASSSFPSGHFSTRQDLTNSV